MYKSKYRASTGGRVVFEELVSRGVLTPLVEWRLEALSRMDRVSGQEAWDMQDRALGKTTQLKCCVLEWMRENPGKTVAWCAVNAQLSKIQVKEIREWANLLGIDTGRLYSFGRVEVGGFDAVFSDPWEY